MLRRYKHSVFVTAIFMSAMVSVTSPCSLRRLQHGTLAPTCHVFVSTLYAMCIKRIKFNIWLSRWKKHQNKVQPTSQKSRQTTQYNQRHFVFTKSGTQ